MGFCQCLISNLVGKRKLPMNSGGCFCELSLRYLDHVLNHPIFSGKDLLWWRSPHLQETGFDRNGKDQKSKTSKGALCNWKSMELWMTLRCNQFLSSPATISLTGFGSLTFYAETSTRSGKQMEAVPHNITAPWFATSIEMKHWSNSGKMGLADAICQVLPTKISRSRDSRFEPYTKGFVMN